jgi:hypothetical protein
MLAKAVGISLRSVQRILEAHQLAPHRIRPFKLSNDPKFAEKLKNIVGLYVDPPAHAVVLSLDEKSQIQALDRTQPGLPMKPGRNAETLEYAQCQLGLGLTVIDQRATATRKQDARIRVASGQLGHNGQRFGPFV